MRRRPKRAYLRCPLLAQLGLMEDPEAWAVLPAGGPDGLSGRLDLEAAWSVKNTMDSELTLSLRITPSSQAPDTAPPEEDPLEYPAGLLGSSPL